MLPGGSLNTREIRSPANPVATWDELVENLGLVPDLPYTNFRLQSRPGALLSVSLSFRFKYTEAKCKM